MDRIVEHGARCAALVAGFHAAKTSGIPISLRKTTSNLFRRREADRQAQDGCAVIRQSAAQTTTQ